jgi:hypothetical protein
MKVTLPATAFLALLLPFLPPRNSPLPAPWPPPLKPSIFQFQFAHILSRLPYEFAQPCLQRTLNERPPSGGTALLRLRKYAVVSHAVGNAPWN